LHGSKSKDFEIKRAFIRYSSTKQQKRRVNLFIWLHQNKFDDAATEPLAPAPAYILTNQ
jgi:hypothetical protein